MRNPQRSEKAFTLTELLVVIGVLAILAASLLPVLASAKPAALRIVCANNLRQVGLGFRVWAINHSGNLPQTLATSQGGAAEDVGVRQLLAQQRTVSPAGAISGSRGVSMMFLVMSNELSTPKILFCPAEYENAYRHLATTFSGTYDGATNRAPYTNDLNVSYFIGVDARDTQPQMFLDGDHNLGGDANPPTKAFCAAPQIVSPSFAVWLGTNFQANMGPSFMANQHDKQGNVGLGDGSVQGWSRSRFQNACKNTGDTGRQPGQFLPATGATVGAGCNRIQLP